MVPSVGFQLVISVLFRHLLLLLILLAFLNSLQSCQHFLHSFPSISLVLLLGPCPFTCIVVLTGLMSYPVILSATWCRIIFQLHSSLGVGFHRFRPFQTVICDTYSTAIRQIFKVSSQGNRSFEHPVSDPEILVLRQSHFDSFHLISVSLSAPPKVKSPQKRHYPFSIFIWGYCFLQATQRGLRLLIDCLVSR